MEKYGNAFWEGFSGMVQWTWRSIVMDVPWYTNYFWGLLLISLLVWALEIRFPWRREQPILRKDFWLGALHVFLHFFLVAVDLSVVFKVVGRLLGDLVLC